MISPERLFQLGVIAIGALNVVLVAHLIFALE
jgi:hypothetical protein